MTRFSDSDKTAFSRVEFSRAAQNGDTHLVKIKLKVKPAKERGTMSKAHTRGEEQTLPVFLPIYLKYEGNLLTGGCSPLGNSPG